MFVGAENSHLKLRRCEPLYSRITPRQQYTPLTPTEVSEIIPSYHPVWQDVSHTDIASINLSRGRGNFRK